MVLLFILAVIVCLASVVNEIQKARSEGKWTSKNIGLWCSVLVIILTLAIFIFTTRDQQKESTEKALMEARQASELERMRHAQEKKRLEDQLIYEEQRSKNELIIKTQQEQLSEAKEVTSAQAAIIKAQKEQNEISKRLTKSQESEIQLLDKVSLNDNLFGVEISFKPSAEHWAKILQAYQETESPQEGVPYSVTPMIAERTGEHWKIKFVPNKVKGGWIKFPSVSTNQDNNKADNNKTDNNKTDNNKADNNKAFENVIREASIGLAVTWGNGTTTIIEPLSKDIDDLPSAIKVSQDEIAFIFRHPQLIWNLNELKAHSVITLRGRPYNVKPPSTFRIRSLDPGVALDQTINMDWKEVKDKDDFLRRLLPLSSGPHHLNFNFIRFSPPTKEASTR